MHIDQDVSHVNYFDHPLSALVDTPPLLPSESPNLSIVGCQTAWGVQTEFKLYRTPSKLEANFFTKGGVNYDGKCSDLSLKVFVGRFTPVAPEYVKDQLDELVDWLRDPGTLEMSPIERAAIAHYKLFYISSAESCVPADCPEHELHGEESERIQS
ncbi:hypothetical protein TELCIR_12074 [Teladorsagia circumcincta]|uniref:Uncharacterized protein n=1 Tax=Teladorsagia circumcincta TaxID=45464 RepID=A0A2G9U7H3_TELCI|nr:hypothetical protein TELCIR_12074 [Teladorsagia circumcincta]